MKRGRQTVVISPCRNEEEFMRATLESVIGQTVRPALWVIVDDGSTDATPEILADYARQHDFIRIVRRDDGGQRRVGPGVIDAFYQGLDTVDLDQFEYVCKLDLDLELPEQYFKILIERMETDPRLGTCSGKPYFVNDAGVLVSEKCGDEMSIGASKFYRVECFREIGGFVREVMWDGIDCHRCRMFGWIACSWDDPEIRFIHLRPMGSSHKGILTGRMRHGYGQYFMGTGLMYMSASALYRLTRPPLIVGGVGMWVGFVKAMLSRRTRLDDPEFRRFLRRYQWACLVKGKERATSELNATQERVWREREAELGHARGPSAAVDTAPLNTA